MKKELIFGLTSIVLVLGLTIWYSQQYQLQVASFANQAGHTQTNTDQQPAVDQTTPTKTLSIALIATHNISTDC